MANQTCVQSCVHHEKLMAVLQESAPDALAGLPAWATGAAEQEDCSDTGLSGKEECPGGRGDGSDVPMGGGKGDGLGLACGGMGSLAMELRQRVFELEGQVFGLEGKLALADDARLGQRVRGVVGGKWLGCFVVCRVEVGFFFLF